MSNAMAGGSAEQAIAGPRTVVCVVIFGFPLRRP